MHAWMDVRVYIHVRACVYSCIYMYVYIYVYTYMHVDVCRGPVRPKPKLWAMEPRTLAALQVASATCRSALAAAAGYRVGTA